MAVAFGGGWVGVTGLCVVGGVEAAFSRRFALKKGRIPVAIHACALVVGELGAQVRVRGGGVPGGCWWGGVCGRGRV